MSASETREATGKIEIVHESRTHICVPADVATITMAYTPFVATALTFQISAPCRALQIDDYSLDPAFVIEDWSLAGAETNEWRSLLLRSFRYAGEPDDDDYPGIIQLNYQQPIEEVALSIEVGGGGALRLRARGKADGRVGFNVDMPARFVHVSADVSPEGMSQLGIAGVSEQDRTVARDRGQNWLRVSDIAVPLLEDFASRLNPQDFTVELQQNTNHGWSRLLATPVP